MLQIYNHLTKHKEPFKPINAKQIGLYVCGMTVYDYCHIGNARIFIIFDTIVKHLRASGYKVNYVRNITDIDDKIIARAKKNGETCQELTERFINIIHEDEQTLGIEPPCVEPRATEHIPQIIELIDTLITKDYAYIATNGDVYYEVKKFPSYGKLAQQDLTSLQAGARVEVTEVKRDPLDFVLWKMSKPGEPEWDSPWGKGRPGWHIECSAMSAKHLGKHFDLHGGGVDLQFPHHQNEIAQSEAAFDCKFVNTWMHVGYVQLNQHKMSKSLGNFFTLREVLKIYHPETIRYFMLVSHYRSPLNYSDENLNKAQAALTTLYTAIRGLNNITEATADKYETQFNAAMDDDFNTPEAIAVLFELAHEINRLRINKQTEIATQLGACLKKLGAILGILQSDPEEFLHANIDSDLKEKIEGLIAARTTARTNKGWQQADQIRDQLTSMGIELEDTAHGTLWSKKP
ncbi:MAG: cysteine--tRNA ligase [Gammaproteobacteria bacterium]|nr:cysteine--tRNA ligase [Gammaproteobacteria bacterium]